MSRIVHRPPALDPSLADLTDDEVRALDRQNAANVDAAPDTEAATLYRPTLQPELAWRSRSGRETPLLIITVGGQAETPTQAALAWRAREIVLLHTDTVREQAEQTAQNLGDIARISLRSIGDGYDLPRLYRVIERAWRDAGCPEGAVVDITGGFKTMSAGAAAAGFRLPGGRVAYVNTDQDTRRRPYWFNTRIELLDDPLTVFGILDRDRGHDLLRAHQFQAAATVFESLATQTRRRPDEWRRDLAKGLAAAEAMDLRTAIDKLSNVQANIQRDVLNDPASGSDPLASMGARQWLDQRLLGLRGVLRVVELAEQGDDEGPQNPGIDPTRSAAAIADPGFLDFIAMLLQLSARRIDDQAHDLAALYDYRAIEAIPQRRLVTLGFNPQAMDWDRAFKVGAEKTGKTEQELRANLARATGRPADEELRPTVDRNFGYAVLAFLLRDAIAPANRLEKIRKTTQLRNESLLAHGARSLSRKGAKDQHALALDLFAKLCSLEGGPSAEVVLARHALPESSFFATELPR